MLIVMCIAVYQRYKQKNALSVNLKNNIILTINLIY